MSQNELFVLIGIALVLISLVVYYRLRKKKTSKHIPIPLPVDEWDSILADLRTASAGIKTQKDLDQLIKEFKPKVDKYIGYFQFRVQYEALIASIVIS